MLMRKNVNNCQQNSLVRVDGRKRCENVTNFFEKGEKKGFSNEYGYVWTGPKSSLLVKLKNACIIPHCNAITNQKTS